MMRRPVKNMLQLFILTLGLLAFSCGGVTQGPDPDVPVDFAYVMDGQGHRLSELRRRPLVLVLMRTSDVLSQLYMDSVTETFAQTAGRLRFLVLTIDPNEAPFVETYAEFEKLPFPIGVAEPDVQLGVSQLGVVPGVPCTYFIDAEGRPEAFAAGVIDKEVLIEKAKRFSLR